MNTADYIKSIEAIIAEYQQVQMANPPTSQQWRDASAEINRLAKLIAAAQSPVPSRFTDPAYSKALRAVTRRERSIRRNVR